MVVQLPRVLPASEVAAIRSAVQKAIVAAPGAVQASLVLPSEHPAAQQLAPALLSALRAQPDLERALYPAALSFPAFHRYGEATSYALQVARPLVGTDPTLRVDLSVLLWLSEKSAYGGGHVLIDEGGAVTRWKGEPGDALAYPAGARWGIEPIAQGELLFCMLELQSRVAGEMERRILLDFQRALEELERRPPSARHAQAVRRVRDELLRIWAEAPRRSSHP
jgi:PKHD-type hydroxylase